MGISYAKHKTVYKVLTPSICVHGWLRVKHQYSGHPLAIKFTIIGRWLLYGGQDEWVRALSGSTKVSYVERCPSHKVTTNLGFTLLPLEQKTESNMKLCNQVSRWILSRSTGGAYDAFWHMDSWILACECLLVSLEGLAR